MKRMKSSCVVRQAAILSPFQPHGIRHAKPFFSNISDSSETSHSGRAFSISGGIHRICSLFLMGMEEKEVAVTPSTEDVVQALLDYFVEPVLPPKRFFETPPLDQHLSVAKQVHAVVLLYNYYQRRLQPHLQFLNLVSFCKLVVVLKPALMPFMKFMHQSDYSQLDDQENQLSPTEKAINDASEFCRILEESKSTQGIERWPVTKVAVLVIDSSMENCLLLRSTSTQGVWSVIEKDVSYIGSEGTVEAKYKNKKRRTIKQPERYNQSIDASGLRKLALFAVKEVAGINPENTKVLESHAVYSLSEEMAAACFYIMQHTRSTSEGFQVPIKDVIERLQGPVVRKTSTGWKASSVAEYFHLLPYAGILSDLISRTPLVNRSCVYQNLSFENVVKIHQQITNPSSSDSSNSKEKEVDGKEKPLEMTFAEELQTCNVETSGSIKSNSNEFIDGKVAGICSQEFISSPTNKIPGAKDIKKLLNFLASEETSITEIALRILSQKIEEICHQQRVLEDKIDLYCREMQKVLDGKAKIQGETHQQGQAQRIIHYPRDASLSFQSPFQELDHICDLNYWRLPRYFISVSTEGFVAKVTMKVRDFDLSFEGALRSTPVAARESAAALLVAKLREMAGEE